eukprot:scaffold45222_cov74-Phaeocystis_antarctica.AAC.3
MQRHRRALRLAQTRRGQGNLPACRSVSPHPPWQTASTEQLARVRRRRPPQQPAPTAQGSSCRRLPASDPHNHSRQVPAVVRAGLLRGEQKPVLGASRSAARRCALRARRASDARTPPWPVVQPIDELHHVNRVEAKLHEARLHRRASVARAVAQPVHHLRHHQLHAVQAERAARRRLPLRRLAVHRVAHAILDQHAVPLVRRVLRAVPSHQPAHPRSCVQVEAQPAVAPLLHVVCVRALAVCRPLAAARYAAHALHPRQLRLMQHKRTQHTTQAARTRTRHHTQQLCHCPMWRVQRRLRPPHRLAQHLDRSQWKSAAWVRLQSATAASLWLSFRAQRAALSKRWASRVVGGRVACCEQERLDHAAAPPRKPHAACTWQRAACRRHQRPQTGRSARARAAAAASPRTSAGTQNPTAPLARAVAAGPRASLAESRRTARARGAAA